MTSTTIIWSSFRDIRLIKLTMFRLKGTYDGTITGSAICKQCRGSQSTYFVWAPAFQKEHFHLRRWGVFMQFIMMGVSNGAVFLAKAWYSCKVLLRNHCRRHVRSWRLARTLLGLYFTSIWEKTIKFQNLTKKVLLDSVSFREISASRSNLWLSVL